MAMDNKRLKNYGEKEAYKYDSAKAGADCTSAANDRALEAETLAIMGRPICSILWDFKIFFDFIDIEILIQEAAATNFPMEELALSLTVHQAPRKLKIGRAMGDTIFGLGRSILAGCKRSTQLARAYTLRMVRRLAAAHPRVVLFQHVDDMTNLIKPETFSSYVEETVNYIMHFASETRRLKMEISEKSIILPVNEHTKKISRIAGREGVHLA